MGKNMFSIGKQVVGLHVGNDTVDLVVLKGTLQGPRLVKFGQTYIYPKKEAQQILPEPTDAAAAETSAPKQETKKTRDEYIIEAIKRVFKENNVKPGNVVSAISSEETMVRYFQMPKIPVKEWVSAIEFEAKRYIPFRMEDVASDYQVAKGPSSRTNMDVVFVVVKKKTVSDFAILLEKAGVKPMIIEPAPFSLIRAFNAAEQINNKVNTAIVNIDSKNANINILRNGVPYIIRDIPLSEGDSSDKSLEPIFEKLLSEIKLSFDFYEKQFPSEVIDKIIIYSSLPLENWHEIVGKELQIPIEAGDPLRGIRIKNLGGTKADKGVVPPKLAIAFGLALRGLSEPFIDVNLWKEKVLAYKSKEVFLKTLFLEASAAIFLLIVLKLVCMRGIAPLAKEFDRTLSERPRAGISIKDDSIESLERMKNKMDARKNLLEKIISTRTYFTDRMVGLAEVVPDNIWLTDVDFKEEVNEKDASMIIRQLTIKGYYLIDKGANETDIINNFLLDLKESGLIEKGMKKADIVSVERTELYGEKIASFKIVFTGP